MALPKVTDCSLSGTSMRMGWNQSEERVRGSWHVKWLLELVPRLPRPKFL